MNREGTPTGENKNAPARQRRRPPQPSQRLVPTYTEEEKIAVVALLVASGGLTIEAIALARQRLNSNVSTSTLTRWLHTYRDRVIAASPALQPQPADLPGVVEKTRGEVATLLNDAFLKYARRLNQDDVADKAAARDAAVVMGIVYDKLEALISPYVEYHDQLKELDMLCRRAAFDMHHVLDDVIASVEKHVINPPSIDVKSLSSGNG